jgi:hypothetical protein
MRVPDLLVLSFAALMTLVPAALRAQDPTDSLPSVEPRDSTLDQDEAWREPDPAERVARRPEAGNPYLREVREEREPRRAPYRRGPVWVTGSLGAGGEAIAAPGAPDPYTRSRLAPTLSFGIGGTVAGLVTGRVYPIRTSGLFLKSGFGVGRYGQDLLDDCGCDGSLVSDYGFAWVVGAGFEAPVSRGLWVGPTIEMVRMNVSGPDGYRERVINVGISLTYDGKN